MLAIIVGIVCAIAANNAAFAFPDQLGYSGAPGSSGRCASSCHGEGLGDIEVLGFPSEYEPDSTYEIILRRLSGDPIRNFNASCRVGSGAENAGLLTGDLHTAAYSVPVETNGIHLSEMNVDSASFLWRAPSAGTGEVRAYISMHQGGFEGPNLNIDMIATEHVIPPPPTSLTIRALTPSALRLRWSAVSGVSNYDVYRDSLSDVRVDSMHRIGSTLTPLYVDSAVVAGSGYYYVITAVTSRN